MSKRQSDLDRREIRLPDGRRLFYYSFPDAPREPKLPQPAPAPRVNPSRPEED
jgi:hypothetical protein